MKTNNVMKRSVLEAGWFGSPGAYILVDGQFGSTGKGLLAAALAEIGAGKIDVAMSNAGPNSGHTAYCPTDGSKIMTQQLPISSIVVKNISAANTADHITVPLTYLNGGAIIDPHYLNSEIEKYSMTGNKVWVHPHAAIIDETAIKAEQTGGPSKIAGTAKGVGAALASKVMRENECVIGYYTKNPNKNVTYHNIVHDIAKVSVVFIETSQGFSLGIHSGFYPFCTSRECTVAQALADARISPRRLKKVAACFRTFPIRVGNTDQGTSGSGYPDQIETTWQELGLEPELTTVTKRVRRVFTWSWKQFVESISVNQPELLFINFMQYVKPEERVPFLEKIREVYMNTLGRPVETVVLGYGPLNSDLYIYDKGKIWFNTENGTDCRNP